ncbi:3961_t:CDS:2 [Funneliformis mosseae]|uniref:3961_t:CDS:1 n=1 Tax=Funneliformis mosseae TaxID=27381 RepID=A0A9N9CD76_FUNMO|nr:3961_t:CDS:2 [Funneliformis mosseae]
MGGNRYDKDREYSSGVGSSYRRSRQEESGGSTGPSEVGRDFASRYGGLFSEKDWKCPICSNINWARRPECNQCKTPKPGLEASVGSREGRGGGFMERDEVVEYRKSRDAEKDDEWDEFGRKRKRKDNFLRGGGCSNNDSDNDDFKSEKSALESNKSGDELEEEEGDDDDRWATWDDIIGNEDSKEANDNKDNKNKSLSTYSERQQRWNKLSHRRSSRSRSPYKRDRSSSRDRRSRKSRSISRSSSRDKRRSGNDDRYKSRSRSNGRGKRIVVDLDLFLGVGKGLVIIEADHAQGVVVTDMEKDILFMFLDFEQ